MIPEAIRADVTGKWTDEEGEEEEEEQHHFRSLSSVSSAQARLSFLPSFLPFFLSSFLLILSQANTRFRIVLETWQEIN